MACTIVGSVHVRPVVSKVPLIVTVASPLVGSPARQEFQLVHWVEEEDSVPLVNDSEYVWQLPPVGVQV
jgi:hypothetical protein